MTHLISLIGGKTLRDQSLLRKCPGGIRPQQAGTSKSLDNLMGWISCCRWPSLFRWFSRSIAELFNPEQNAATTLLECQNDPLWLGMARYFHWVWKGLISPTWWYHITRQLGAPNIWHVHFTPQSSTNTTVQLLLQLSKEAMRFQLAWEPCTTWWSSMPPRAGMRWLFPSASRL